jgi:hypothetical protein
MDRKKWRKINSGSTDTCFRSTNLSWITIGIEHSQCITSTIIPLPEKGDFPLKCGAFASSWLFAPAYRGSRASVTSKIIWGKLWRRAPPERRLSRRWSAFISLVGVPACWWGLSVCGRFSPNKTRNLVHRPTDPPLRQLRKFHISMSLNRTEARPLRKSRP